jgi:hypothetical protein
MRNGLSALDTALELLHRDLFPVLLHPLGASIRKRDGPGKATGKEPIGSAWGKSRPTEASLQARFGRCPAAGVGLVLGPAGGVVDLEIDGPRGKESLLSKIAEESMPLVSWVCVRFPDARRRDRT